MDLNFVAGVIGWVIGSVAVAGIVMGVLALLRGWPSPVPRVCYCCGGPTASTNAAYCRVCWPILVAAGNQNRTLHVWHACRAAQLKGAAPSEVQSAMQGALIEELAQ